MEDIAVEVISLTGEALLSTIAAASSCVNDIHDKLQHDEARRARQTLLCQERKLLGTELLDSLTDMNTTEVGPALTLHLVEHEELTLDFVVYSDDIDDPFEWRVKLVPVTADTLRGVSSGDTEELPLDWLPELLDDVRTSARGENVKHVERLKALAHSARMVTSLHREEGGHSVLLAGHCLTLNFISRG